MPEEPLPPLPPEPSWVAKVIAAIKGASKVIMELAKVAVLLTTLAASIWAAWRAGTAVEQNVKIEQKQDDAKAVAEVATDIQVSTLKAVARQTDDPEAKAAVQAAATQTSK